MEHRKFFIIDIVIVFILLLFLLFLLFVPKNTAYSLDELKFTRSPYPEFTTHLIAKMDNIDEQDIPFYSPEPKETGINEGLMYEYHKYYGKGLYQGKQSTKYNNLLYQYSIGKMDEKQVLDEINSHTAWEENYYGISRTKKMQQQVIVTDSFIDSFSTKSKIANEIWGEIANKNLLRSSDYYEVLIYYNKETKENTVNVLSVDLAYIQGG